MTFGVRGLCLLLLASPACGGSDGETGPEGEMGARGSQGEPGEPGEPGADGQLRIYGDGSAGAFTAVTDNLDEVNLQFTDFTVPVGVTLLVHSGTVIRCSGTFTVDGTINLLTSAVPAKMYSDGALLVPAGVGIARGGAANGRVGLDSSTQFGGLGGTGLNQTQARSLLQPGPHGGGGGGSGLTGIGGEGGGSFTVLAQGGISIGSTGVIDARGDNGQVGGAGGGGGGVVILASPASIAIAGTITANGGDGGATATDSGRGGQGGGGIVHLLAPSIDVTGAVTANQGAAGATPTAVEATTRSGGGGGGGSGGTGFTGGTVLSDDTAQAPTSGSNGYVFESELDPTALF